MSVTARDGAEDADIACAIFASDARDLVTAAKNLGLGDHDGSVP
jgi:hypothetical protein